MPPGKKCKTSHPGVYLEKTQNLIRVKKLNEINFKNLTWRKCEVYDLIVDCIFILPEKYKMLCDKGITEVSITDKNQPKRWMR